MNLFDNKYPYTDFHELNLSWVIQQIEQVNVDLSSLEERVKAASIEASKDYVNQQMTQIRSEFSELTTRVEGLNQYFEDTVQTLQNDYSQFTQTVQAQIVILTNRIEAFREELNASIVGVNARTDLAIKQNNDFILSNLEGFLSGIKVINYFTGEKVSVQEMLDYLASLHADNAITYTTLAERLKTFEELAGLNITYTQLAFNGNILIN